MGEVFKLNHCYNVDCVPAMELFPDNYFDLAVVDPPYFSGPERRGFYGSKVSKIGVHRDYPISPAWIRPGPEYFRELLRVSRHYIVWGCNYFDYKFATGRIVWDKCNGSSSFSDCEIAATDLFTSVRLFRYMWSGMMQGKSLGVDGNTVNFYTSTDKSGTAAFSVDFPSELFLDQTKTTFVAKFKFDAATYPGATDPKLEGKPVMVLAVKGENPDSCTYSFLSMAALVDTYKAKATGKDASTTVTIAGYEVDVKVNVSAAAGNALVLKDDGLYVPTPEEVDISGKADKVTGATTGNFAALDGEGNLTDSGKKPADFVGAEAGKRLMSDAEGEKLAGVSEGATKTAASSTNGNVNIDGKEVVVYTEPENVLHDEDVEDFSAEEIAALLADAD